MIESEVLVNRLLLKNKSTVVQNHSRLDRLCHEIIDINCSLI